jgi:gliding motility-associated-like protein
VLIGKIGSVSGSFGSSEYIGPYDDSDYYLTIQNSFGNRHRDTIYDVLAKAVKADFEVKKYDNDGNEEDYSEDAINEAMLQIGLVNESENETRYHWKGFNDSLNILDGSRRILWENRQENPSLDSIPKYKPGKYAVRLIVENEYNCIDSLTFYHVSVDSSFIDSTLIPNVFTPNGDGANDVFVLPKKDNLTGNGSRGFISMKRIEVTIMNRNGELVYQYDGHPLDWNGWEGKVKNSNRDASEGIYLYVIKGVGYDGVKHESRHYTGFLYLFR